LTAKRGDQHAEVGLQRASNSLGQILGTRIAVHFDHVRVMKQPVERRAREQQVAE
jgi:hypothetical protein